MESFQYIGYDYTADMEYMDLAVRCQTKAIKLNQSLTLLIVASSLYWFVVFFFHTWDSSHTLTSHDFHNHALN